MGTIFSTLPSAFDESTVTQCFQKSLAAAAARQNREDSSNSSRHRINRGSGMLQSFASTLITESVFHKNENEGSGGPPQVSSQESRLSNRSDGKKGSRKALDINRNPGLNNNTDSCKAIPSTSLGDPLRNSIINQKPFQPESWPTLDMVHDHLRKHVTLPTTIIFARFLPTRHFQNYVEIRYSVTESTNEIIFECSDKLETLIAPKEDFQRGDTKEDDIKYFLLIFKTCINSLQGQIWWNGFSFILNPTPKNRLKVSALETQPISQVLFELTGMKEVEVHRTDHRVELRGQVDGSAGSEKHSKSMRVRGVSTIDMKVKQLRGNLITLHIPVFSEERIKY